MSAGVLVVDKPEGPTSHDVVATARRVLRERRIGHCGTLDPMATGVLVLAIGVATRLVPYLSADDKHYDAVVRLGIETDTDDVTGTVGRTTDLRPGLEALETALEGFRGTILQTPPRFSAKKVDGVRAYELARRNADDQPALRQVPVTCHDLTLTGFDGERVHLQMRVSAGFYVRALARDLGRALGTGAALEALRRTRSGSFGLDQAVGFQALAQGSVESLRPRVRPLEALLPEVPLMPLGGAERALIGHGGDVAMPASWTVAPALARLVDAEGHLVALAVPAKRAGFLHPTVVLG
jgi:tRNA pseudouridine55 synthase